MNVAPTDAVPPEASDVVPKQVVAGNAVAERLIAAGRRPLVLGVVVVRSGDDLAAALFEALAHVSNGADGIDLTLPAALSPGERLAVADQLAEATSAAFYLRTDVPMACGEHTLIVSATADRLRASVKVVYDIGFDPSEADTWPPLDDERSFLISTVGLDDSSDASLMGLASAASARGVAAVSTDRARIVRRVVDTLAPLYPKVPNAGETSCR